MPRLLRCGGSFAVYAVRTTVERIMSLSNHVSTYFVLFHYQNPLVPEKDVARAFLCQFVRTTPRIGPATLVSIFFPILPRSQTFPNARHGHVFSVIM